MADPVQHEFVRPFTPRYDIDYVSAPVCLHDAPVLYGTSDPSGVSEL